MESSCLLSMGLEALESRQFLSVANAGDAPGVTPLAVGASGHHAHFLHHKHRLHHLAHLHRLHIQHRQHVHRAHLHRVHHLHILHKAHVLRTTVPEPIVLTAQQRTNWASIRDAFLANRKRI
jgi:hypothetical protein